MQPYQDSKQALGSTVSLTVVSDAAPAAVQDLLRRLWLEVFLFEKRCSRFLPNSELSQFNRAAGVGQHVSPEFRDVLQAAKRLGEQTDGLYNPFVLPALQKAGYRQSLVAGHHDDPVDDFSNRQVVPVDSLDIRDNSVSIPYGTAIDLGGCGKGYIGDGLARIARAEAGVQGFWFSIGGDIVTFGVDEQGKPWEVAVSPNVRDTADQVAKVVMPDGGQYAIATSTTALRKGNEQGKAWHHIIDPRTGQPAVSDITLATLCLDSLLMADVLASCVIIIGNDEADAFMRRHEVRAALIGRFVEQAPAVTINGQPVGRTFRTYGQGIRLLHGDGYNTNNIMVTSNV